MNALKVRLDGKDRVVESRKCEECGVTFFDGDFIQAEINEMKKSGELVYEFTDSRDGRYCSKWCEKKGSEAA